MTSPGRLVVVEGIDGSGKSTLVHRLAEALKTRGIDALATKEPTDGPHGTRIRSLAAAGERLPVEEELALFEKDRAAHTLELVRPALAEGRWVIQDRGFHSTAAYQGARGLDRDWILRRSRALAPEPDVLLWLALPIEAALARVDDRGDRDAFEAQLEGVAAYFAGIPGAHRVDASASADAVLKRALSALGLPV
ncbi:MAG: dTMP kinase [Myxococcota bacterium]